VAIDRPIKANKFPSFLRFPSPPLRAPSLSLSPHFFLRRPAFLPALGIKADAGLSSLALEAKALHVQLIFSAGLPSKPSDLFYSF
jgi:hypothetical protein